MELNLYKYAQIELERRFLLRRIPKDLDLGGVYTRIIDKYLPGTRLRLRRFENPGEEFVVGKMTQKYQELGQSDQERVITNIYLNEEEYRSLAKLPGAQLSKKRYRYFFEPHNYSVDVFEGNLKGLVMCEVEAREGVDLVNIKVPRFAEKEITADPFFHGSNLARLSEEEFARWLADR